MALGAQSSANQRLHVALPLLGGFQSKLLISLEAGLPVPGAGVSIPLKGQGLLILCFLQDANV